MQFTRGVGNEQDGLPPSKPWQDGELEGPGRRDLKVGITNTLGKKIVFKKLEGVYGAMKPPVISLGKQRALNLPKAGLLSNGLA